MFAGSTAVVGVAAGQKLVASAEAPVGLSAGAIPQTFQYGLCYQDASVAGTSIINFVGGNYSIGLVTPDRQAFPASALVIPGAGSWRVGFCILNGSAATINNNDFVNGWVMVIS